MNKLQNALQGKKTIAGFVMAFDPCIEKTKETIVAMEKAGVGMIQIGIPFSDPVVDGDIVIRANFRALDAGFSLNGIFEMLGTIQISVPIVFSTYCNPVFVYGYEKFFANCQKYGVDGVIILDLPIEEQDEAVIFAQQYGIAFIRTVPKVDEKRIAHLATGAEGFLSLFYPLRPDVDQDIQGTDIQNILSTIRKTTDIPVLLGVEEKESELFGKLFKVLDGIILKDSIVSLMETYGDQANEKIAERIRAIAGKS